MQTSSTPDRVRITAGDKHLKAGYSARLLDWLFLLGLTLATCWAVDPLVLNLDSLPFVKHIPGALMFPVLLLSLVFFKRSRLIARDRANDLTIYILIAFGLFVSFGSIYARFVKEIDNTFMTMGLYSFGAPLTYWFIRRSTRPLFVINKALVIYFTFAVAASAAQFSKLAQPGLFHNREHLVIGALTLAYFIQATRVQKIASLLAIVAVGVASQKNTAFLVTGFVLLYILLVHAMARAKKIRDSASRLIYWFILGVLAASTAAVAYGLSILMADVSLLSGNLPTGNPEYRTHTYDKAMAKFLQSPLWGNAFTEAASEEFELYTVDVSTQILPTHSDPLDILANGGVVGISLWVAIYLLLAKRWISYAKRRVLGDPTNRTKVHIISCIVFSSPITLAFNPVLNSPNLAFSLWAMIGILMSLLSRQPSPMAQR